MVNWFQVNRCLYSGVFSASSCGYSKLTLGGDGQYCIVVSIATLSHCIEGIDREVVGGGRLQASDSEGCCSGRKDVHVEETGCLFPTVSVNQKVQVQFFDREGFNLKQISSLDISPYTKSLLQTSIEAGDPLQCNWVMGEANLAKRRRRIWVIWGRKKRRDVNKQMCTWFYNSTDKEKNTITQEVLVWQRL